jgi:hypothetical protein
MKRWNFAMGVILILAVTGCIVQAGLYLTGAG